MIRLNLLDKAWHFGVGVSCTPDTHSNPFFFLPKWWLYITTGEINNITHVCEPTTKIPDDLWKVGLAVIDMILTAAGFIAVISIIIAGLMYITAGGEPQKAASARTRIYNALIGLAIVFVGIAVVRFIGFTFG